MEVAAKRLIDLYPLLSDFETSIKDNILLRYSNVLNITRDTYDEIYLSTVSHVAELIYNYYEEYYLSSEDTPFIKLFTMRLANKLPLWNVKLTTYKSVYNAVFNIDKNVVNNSTANLTNTSSYNGAQAQTPEVIGELETLDYTTSKQESKTDRNTDSTSNFDSIVYRGEKYKWENIKEIPQEIYKEVISIFNSLFFVYEEDDTPYVNVPIDKIVYKLEEEVKLLDAAFKNISQELKDVETGVINLDVELGNLTQRVTANEREINNLGKSVESIDREVEDLDNKTTQIQTQLNNLENDTYTIEEVNSIKTELETTIGNVAIDVSTLESDVGTLNSTVSTLESDVSTINSTLINIGSNISDIEQDLLGKFNKPTNSGSIGQVIKKTANGSEWQDESGGGGGGSVDSEFSLTSTNALQNKTITQALTNNLIGTKTSTYNLYGYFDFTVNYLGDVDPFSIMHSSGIPFLAFIWSTFLHTNIITGRALIELSDDDRNALQNLINTKPVYLFSSLLGGGDMYFSSGEFIMLVATILNNRVITTWNADNTGVITSYEYTYTKESETEYFVSKYSEYGGSDISNNIKELPDNIPFYMRRTGGTASIGNASSIEINYSTMTSTSQTMANVSIEDYNVFTLIKSGTNVSLTSKSFNKEINIIFDIDTCIIGFNIIIAPLVYGIIK